jgi:hypothetical protein
MLDHGLWAIAITILIGLATATALFFRHYRLARILIVMETISFLGSWGIAQLPYILPPDLTISQAASPPTTMREFFFSALVGTLVLLPSLWFLFHLFKFQQAVPVVHEKQQYDHFLTEKKREHAESEHLLHSGPPRAELCTSTRFLTAIIKSATPASAPSQGLVLGYIWLMKSSKRMVARSCSRARKGKALRSVLPCLCSGKKQSNSL